MWNWKTFIGTAALAASIIVGPAVGSSVAEDKVWQTLKAISATPMSAHDMYAVKGKISLADYLAAYLVKTTTTGVKVFSLGGGTVNATWNTGTSSGSWSSAGN